MQVFLMHLLLFVQLMHRFALLKININAVYLGGWNAIIVQFLLFVNINININISVVMSNRKNKKIFSISCIVLYSQLVSLDSMATLLLALPLENQSIYSFPRAVYF